MSTQAPDATSKERPATKQEPPKTPASQQPAADQTIQLDDSKVQACYTNFCRVTGTPEELIFDFALNTQPFGQPTEPLVVTQRLVANFYTAKRLLHALHMTLQRHEGAFGVLETNVQKRVQGPRG